MVDLLTTLPTSLVRSIISQWVGPQSSGQLDAAYCNHAGRGHWLEILNNSEVELLSNGFSSYSRTFEQCSWLLKRIVKCSKLVVSYSEILSLEHMNFWQEYAKTAAGHLKTVSVAGNNHTIAAILLFIAEGWPSLSELRLQSASVDPENYSAVASAAG